MNRINACTRRSYYLHPMHDHADHHIDKSKLYRAWEKHYAHLSSNKMRQVVLRKAQRLRCPPGYRLEQLLGR